MCLQPEECWCKPGWSGDTCSECLTSWGCVNGYCEEPFQCICEDGFLGKDCNSTVPTGKSLSEALFLHQLTHNMTTDCSLNYKFNMYMKIPSSNLRRTCCVQKFFLTFRTIFVHNMFSPYSGKRRASDKDLPVLVELSVTVAMIHAAKSLYYCRHLCWI